MKQHNSALLFLLLHNIVSSIEGSLISEKLDPALIEANLNVSSLSKHIKGMIEHFKKDDPVGLPGAPIPDPMPTPDMKYSKSMVTFLLKDGKVHGLSKFRIEQIMANLDSLEVDILLTYDKLEVLGNYTANALFQRSHGGFNISVVSVSLGGTAALSTNREGHLQASKLDMDLSFKDVKIDFKNLSLFLSFVQDVINQIGTFVFDTIKPQVLKEVNTNIKSDINKALSQMKKTFPNSIPPLDLAIAEGRKFVRDSGYDPFPVEDYMYTAGLLTVNVKDIWLSGLATFYRIGNVSIAIRRNSVSITSHISTQQLEGKCTWEASLNRLLSTYGSTGFTVQYVQVMTRFNQSLDLRKRLVLEEMDVRLGNVQLRMDGMGTLDYCFEALANILPNILRYQIVDGVEGMIKQRMQYILSSLDLEELVDKHVISTLEAVIATNQTVNDLESSYEITDDPFNVDELYEDIVF